jgi:hypothetical protein
MGPEGEDILDFYNSVLSEEGKMLLADMTFFSTSRGATLHEILAISRLTPEMLGKATRELKQAGLLRQGEVVLEDKSYMFKDGTDGEFFALDKHTKIVVLTEVVRRPPSSDEIRNELF